MSESERTLASGALDSRDGIPVAAVGWVRKLAGLPWEGDSGPDVASTDRPQDNCGAHVSESSPPSPIVIPLPDFPPSLFSFHPHPLPRFSLHPLYPLLVRAALHLRPR